jgi:tRNA(Ile)-lysidine synthase
MLKDFESFIRKEQLIEVNDPLLIAVSGGIDSMVLLHLCMQSEMIRDFAVAHSNFQLRGKESDKDEIFIVNFCNTHHIPVFTKKFDTEQYAKAQGISIQMAARELRYGWFDNLAKEKGFGKIALAQHLDDQTSVTGSQRTQTRCLLYKVRQILPWRRRREV